MDITDAISKVKNCNWDQVYTTGQCSRTSTISSKKPFS